MESILLTIMEVCIFLISYQDHDYDCVPDTRWGVGSEGWMPSPSLRVSERVQILWVVGGWAQTRPLPGLVHVGCVVGGLFLSLSYLQSG